MDFTFLFSVHLEDWQSTTFLSNFLILWPVSIRLSEIELSAVSGSSCFHKIPCLQRWRGADNKSCAVICHFLMLPASTSVWWSSCLRWQTGSLSTGEGLGVLEYSSEVLRVLRVWASWIPLPGVTSPAIPVLLQQKGTGPCPDPGEQTWIWPRCSVESQEPLLGVGTEWWQEPVPTSKEPTTRSAAGEMWLAQLFHSSDTRYQEIQIIS